MLAAAARELERELEFARYLGRLPIELNEIAKFFESHPWLSITFRISSITPPAHVVSYFRDLTDIRTITSDLATAQTVTAYPVVHGGLADIYRATLADGTQVAVKRLRQRPEGDSKELKHTARELEAWSKLDHPNILRLLGLAELHEMLSMVSPWLEYGSVTSALKKWPNLPRYAYCKQLADAVAYLHSPQVDVIHGDIKGDNVLLDEHGHIKLTDFGLAIVHEQSMRFSETDPGGGTIRWMAPELLSEEGGRSKETDVWAMGMTMMEIMTGKAPFEEIKRGTAVMQAVSQRRIPNISQLQAEPQSARASIMHGALLWCWTYEPDQRATAAEVQTLMGVLRPTT